MGLFDRVICHMPLPGCEPGRDWQTKSLECQMSIYKIRHDGTLLRNEIDDDEYHPCNLTGEIRFYNDQYAFSAYFVDGQLTELHRIQRPS